MKLFSKVFIAIMLFLCGSLTLSGYLLISISYRQALDKEINNALEQYQMMQFIIESKTLGEDADILGDNGFFENLIPESYQSSVAPHMLAVFYEDMKTLYNDYPNSFDNSLFQQMNAQKLSYKIQQSEDDLILTVMGHFTLQGTPVHMAVGTNINSIIDQRNQMESAYTLIYGVVFTLGIIVALVYAIFLVRPIKKMTHSTARIAAGDYSVRVDVKQNDELGELCNNFNIMVDAVEDSIQKLTEDAVRKEEFLSNFSHELKTPLTSVIGYADMISHKDMTRHQIKHAAQYIVEEGLRLEDLSIKLMDLIVLNKQDFVFEELPAKDLLQNITETLAPLFEEKNCKLILTVEDAYIRVEYDLFKTMLLNLLDNAVKADAKNITLKGQVNKDNYDISISDDGRGIPETDIDRITEAFYMVDKSRSRQQHGVGLGLSLVSRIAKLHGASLAFNSTEDAGTIARLTLPVQGGEES